MQKQKLIYNKLVLFYNQSKRKLKRLMLEGKNERKQNILKRRLFRLYEKLNNLQSLFKGSFASVLLVGTVSLLPINEVKSQSFSESTSDLFFDAYNYVQYVRNHTFVDLDNDGDMDLIEVKNNGNFLYYENIGTDSNFNFSTSIINPFSLTNTGCTSNRPSFVDLDDDGDLDLMLGESLGNFKYFQNIGTASSPVFSAMQTNPFSLQDIGNNTAPTFADLDNDGDFDMMVGEFSGNFRYFQNTGTASSPIFLGGATNPFSLTDVGLKNVPTFVDIDNDNDMDLYVGTEYDDGYGGSLRTIINIGSNISPNFVMQGYNPGGDLGCSASFADLDNDGDMDMVVGNTYYSQYYENGLYGPPQDIEIIAGTSGQTIIVNGDNTPSVIEKTQFGNAGICSQTIVNSYKIYNRGFYNASVNLTISNPTISGNNASDFTVSVNPTSLTIGSGSNNYRNFSITFNPSSPGIKTALVTILSNDPDEATYSFVIEGTAIDDAPAISYYESDARCDGGVVDLLAYASIGTAIVKWYSAPSGGSLLSTGEIFAPNIGVSTTFYVEAVNGTCVSLNRTPVDALIGNCTQLQTQDCSKQLSLMTDDLFCDIVASATDYKYEVSDGTNTYFFYRGNNTNDFKMSNIPNLSYSTTYTVKVASLVNNKWSAYGSICNITTPTIISEVNSNFCGISLINITTQLFVLEVPSATNYKYEAFDGTNTLTWIKGSGLLGFKMSNFSGVLYNTTYQVRVAAYVNGVWQDFGNSCAITTPSMPRVKVQYCNETISTLQDQLMIEGNLNATNYKYEAFDGSNTLTWIKGSGLLGFKMSNFTGVLFNTIYQVRVAAYVNGVWQTFGNSCSITTPNMPRVKVQYCNETINTLSDQLMIDGNLNATNYKYEAFDGSNTLTWIKGSGLLGFKMSNFVGVLFNTTYQVRVAAYVNGVWQAFGNSCAITTPNMPRVKNEYCNTTISTMTNQLSIEGVINATNYKFEAFDGTNTLTWIKGSGLLGFKMSNFSGVQYNRTYQVRVAAYVNGVWQDFGNNCMIITPVAREGNPTSSQLADDLNEQGFEFSIYPNPNSGTFAINSTEEGIFQIINELGQLIQIVEFTKENKYKTKIDGLDRGVYFLKGIVKGKAYINKIVVE